MIIGFSSGCLYKTHEGLAKSTIDIFRNVGCNAIELMFHDYTEIGNLAKINAEDLASFEYVSLHAPNYKTSEKGLFINCLEAILELNRKRKLDLVVLHPDAIKDWSIFSDFDLPFAIENMDNRKKSHQGVDDLKKTLERDFNGYIVLDLSHCFVNDCSMKLAEDIKDNLREKIKEIHLSGHETFHDLLHKTNQKEILAHVVKNVPIIIESGCEDVEEVLREYAYVKREIEN